jgi:hypothetical protein
MLMKRMVVAGLVLSAALSFMTGPLARADEELKPAIYLPQIRYDFGKVFEQDMYEHDFVVKNRGKADLVIEQVKPG